jgi:hypothetical protein
MPDDQRSSTASIVIVILVVVVMLGLVGLCACGGLGFFMLRSMPVPQPPTAVPSQPVAPPTLVAPPAEEPPAPTTPELKSGEGESDGANSPKAEQDDPDEVHVANQADVTPAATPDPVKSEDAAPNTDKPDHNGPSPELLDMIRTAIQNKELAQTDLASVMRDEEIDQDGALVTDVPDDGGILIGFDLHWDGEASCMIDCMRPIYLTAKGEIQGHRCGAWPHKTIKAKPGYAVGGLRYRATNKTQLVRGFFQVQVDFMQIDGTRLDPNDSYHEEFGFGPIGEVSGVLGGTGAPIVGVRLAPLPPFKEYIVGAFGLVLLGD